ncbi:FAD:protein FMN transferase [Candidatus Bipolaricaulota bacterium]|nr:FAD:protein FMN transferase [Candidatus Bipolaricaulota bacterium]
MNQKEQKNSLTRRKFLKWTTGGLLGAGALTLGLNSWKRTAKGTTAVTQTRPAMGTFVEITAGGEKKKKVKNLINKAYEKIIDVDKTMSVHKDNSPVHNLNNPGNKKINLRPNTLQVLEEAQNISRLTDGSFDITSGPLLDLWGFYDGKLSVPSPDDLKQALNLVDYQKLTLEPSSGTATLPDRNGKIDLGGIAKGYAVDKAVEVLKNGGVQSGLVNAGGDIRAFGSPEGKSTWKVGLQNPLQKNDLLFGLNLFLSAITTSGNYESFFTYRGNKLAHIINPHTGWPVEDVLSVSVLTEKAIRADGLSTGAFCQGKDEALATIEKLEDTELIYIHKSEKGKIEVEMTEGLADRINGNRLEVQLN